MMRAARQRFPRRLPLVVALVTVVLLGGGGVAWAHDNPLDGAECKPPGEQPGEIKTEYTPDQPNSSKITYYCQNGPPVLTVEIFTGLVVIGPDGTPPLPSGQVTADPPGTTCESQERICTIEYADDGVEVTLRAVANGPASEFDRWGGECESAGTSPVCAITMDRSKAVTATFASIRP